jgi:hypothetical protein
MQPAMRKTTTLAASFVLTISIAPGCSSSQRTTHAAEPDMSTAESGGPPRHANPPPPEGHGGPAPETGEPHANPPGPEVDKPVPEPEPAQAGPNDNVEIRKNGTCWARVDVKCPPPPATCNPPPPRQVDCPDETPAN